MPHIYLSRKADAMLIAPCSADFVARLAQGRADELLSLACLARPAQRVPLLLAPAMNREMWAHPATRRNLAQVVQDGAVVLGVGSGEQACGETGAGRMLEPQELLDELLAFFPPKLLARRPPPVTPTLPGGKRGLALARAAREAGAEVTLVAGPVYLTTPRGVRRVDVQSAQEMLVAVEQHIQDAGVFMATAAVADWRPAQQSGRKIKKDGSGQPPVLDFVENPDILATLARSARALEGALFCVGFSAESHDLLANATAKRARKGVPLLVGNIGPATFGRDDNALLLVDADGHRELP